MRDRRAAFRLRQQDHVRAPGHHAVEIGVGQAGVERVDPHDEARTLRLGGVLLQVGERGFARAGLAVGRDRILQIEDDRVGAGLGPLGEFAFAVGRDEEE